MTASPVLFDLYKPCMLIIFLLKTFFLNFHFWKNLNFCSICLVLSLSKYIILILKEWINKNEIDVVITTGGTGLTGRDITPEAIDEIADKQIPGFGEVFRNISLKTVGTSAIQSRACAVLANGKYVFALPGSSGGVTDAWDGILKHQLDINHKPCNFVELFPRLKEK